MRKSRASKKEQERLIEYFVAGTTARCTADLVDINRKTAAYFFKRLREIIAIQLEKEAQEIFSSKIEVDESYLAAFAKEKEERPRNGRQSACIWPSKAGGSCLYEDHS